jgi:hypothetical protein
MFPLCLCVLLAAASAGRRRQQQRAPRTQAAWAQRRFVCACRRTNKPCHGDSTRPPHAASACQLIIRQIDPTVSVTAPLNLREVILYDSLATKVPFSSLTATMSSTYVPDRAFPIPVTIDKCFDGVTDYINPADSKPSLCSTALSDTQPWLKILYPCSITLSKVEVYNRPDPLTPVAGCCRDRINPFKLDFVNENNVTTLSYPFSVSQDVYTITGRCRGELGDGTHTCSRPACVCGGIDK